MTKTKKNKRKPIEIYFILYLAALVLLISKSDNKQNSNSLQQKKFDIPFTIKIEKPILNCKIWTDSLGNQKYYIDSLNYIWNVGEVEDVRYEFIVEDQNLKHSVKLHKDQNSNKTFSFVEDRDNQMAIFHWNPTIYEQENKIFTVYVVATAVLSNSTNQERLKTKSQFNLIITHENANSNNSTDYYQDYVQAPLNSKKTLTNDEYISNSRTYQINSPQGTINLQPAFSRIAAIANREWENKIFCFNLSPKVDFAKPPTIKIINSPENNGGTASVSSYQDNFIVLTGTTPSFGSTKIFFTVLRKGDLSEATTSFEIFPKNIQQAVYPKIMYPEQTYNFNPKLPQNLNNTAFLKESHSNKIRAASYQGEPFDFTPKTSDTGTFFSFERYSDSKLVGTTISIKVESYPEPEISKITELSKNILILNTISYGWFNNKENRIQELLITGNAKYKQSYGKSFDDKKNSIWYEQFEITPIDENKPFNFKLVAVDTRGTKSKEKKY